MKNAKFFETNGVQHLQPAKILSAINPLLNSVTAAQASLPEWYRRAWQVKLNSSTTAGNKIERSLITKAANHSASLTLPSFGGVGGGFTPCSASI
jgi:hypothetical protein